MLKNVAQSLLQEVNRELLSGFTLGLTLTYAGGEIGGAIGRSYKDPKKDPLVPYGAGLGIPSVIGSTAAYLSSYRNTVLPGGTPPYATGYLIGSMTGLLLSGVTAEARRRVYDSNVPETLSNVRRKTGNMIRSYGGRLKERIGGIRNRVFGKPPEVGYGLY